MGIRSVVCAGLVLASLCLYNVYAMELCEPRDYYNLANSSKCKIKDSPPGNTQDTRELMFEILKTYPYENKDLFAKLLQTKIELVDTYLVQQQKKRQTYIVKTDSNKLIRTKQDLAGQLEKVNSATPDNWESVRDRARDTLDEAATRLRDVE